MSKLLTIGFPTCYDFSGAMFTIRGIVQYQTFDEGDIEIVVVDNTPDEKYRSNLKREIKVMNDPSIRYVEHLNDLGPASAKNRVFEEAQGEYVLCIDSHVLFDKNAIWKLKLWLGYKQTPEMSRNLFSGPMMMTNGNLSTHMKPQWRGHAWGIWQQDEKKICSDEEPKKVWGQGCGCLFAKNEHWLKFSDDFRGFGGEEGYIHEKYRAAGRDFYILPFLKWWHRFGNPDTKHYNNTLYSKVRNFYIGHKELNLPIENVYNHFVKTDYPIEEIPKILVEEFSIEKGIVEAKLGDESALRTILSQRKMSKDDWDWLEENPIEHIEPKKDLINELFNAMMKEPKNDVSQHYNILKTFASNANTVLDITRRPMATVALMAGKPEKITSYVYDTNTVDWSQFSPNVDIIEADSFEGTVAHFRGSGKRYDLLFVKFPHDHQGVFADLVDLSELSDTIIINDTQFKYMPKIAHAMRYMIENRGWNVVYHANNQWGMTVISKTIKPENKVIAWIPEEGPGTELKKILKSYGLTEMKNCGCNMMVDQMNIWGPELCRKNKDTIKAFVKKNAAKWFKTEEANWWKMTTIGLKMVTRFINPLSPYDGIVDMAIHNAEYNEVYPDKA